MIADQRSISEVIRIGLHWPVSLSGLQSELFSISCTGFLCMKRIQLETVPPSPMMTLVIIYTQSQQISKFAGILSIALHGKQMGKQWKQCQTFILGGSRITADGDCSHEIKRRLLLGRKVMTNLDNIFKSRDNTLPTKVCLVKAMVFPVVMYGCESWTVKKAEC